MTRNAHETSDIDPNEPGIAPRSPEEAPTDCTVAPMIGPDNPKEDPVSHVNGCCSIVERPPALLCVPVTDDMVSDCPAEDSDDFIEFSDKQLVSVVVMLCQEELILTYPLKRPHFQIQIPQETSPKRDQTFLRMMLLTGATGDLPFRRVRPSMY